MADRFDANVRLTTSAGTSQTTMRLSDDVKSYYDDMVAAGCMFDLRAASDFVESNNNKAQLSILRGDAVVDFDNCPSMWTDAEALAAELLRREPWLQLPPAQSGTASAKLVPGGRFKAAFAFHHLNGDVAQSETNHMDECMRPYYQDMLDAGCTLRWTLTPDMQPEGEVAVVLPSGDKIVKKMVHDGYTGLTEGFVELLRLEPWTKA